MSVLDDVQLTLVDSIAKIAELKKWYDGLDIKEDVMGFDTETTGLDIFSPDFKLRTIQIGNRSHGWTIPYEGFGGVALELIKDWERRHGIFTAHNLSYDAKVMRRCTGWMVPWHLFHDTYLLARLDDPDGPAGLKEVTDKHVDPSASAGQDDLKKAFKDYGWDWATVPIDFEPYWFYGALDPVLAVHLLDHYRPVMERYHKAYDLEFSVRRICTDVEYRGMRIDLEYTERMGKEFTRVSEEGHKYALDRWGIRVGSTPDLAKLFTGLGAKFSVFTGKGAPSVSKEQLDIFCEDENIEIREAAQHILKIRAIDKVNSSYFENFLKMHVDGWLYPNINTMQALTHRMSVTNPALQTLPSGDSKVRNCFLADTDDEVIVSCDYSSQELRLSAHFANEEGLTEAFRKADEEGADVFIESGKLIFDDPSLTKENAGDKRGTIKTFFYASGYGAGIPKMASQLGIPESEMQEVADMIDKTFPGIKKFSKKIIEDAELISKSGHMPYAELEDNRRIPTYPRSEYKLVNYTFQGTAAIMTKKALLRLDAMGLSKYIKMAIHDEVLFSVPRVELSEIVPQIEEAMSFLTGYNLPFPAEPEADGVRWGNAYCEYVSEYVDIGKFYSSENELRANEVKIVEHKDDLFTWECEYGHKEEKKIQDKVIYPECNRCLLGPEEEEVLDETSSN